MSWFMDVHSLPEDATMPEIAQAHAADLRIQGQYGVTSETYWVSLRARKLFCLIEAPSAEAANRVHREARGLVADQLYEVTRGS